MNLNQIITSDNIEYLKTLPDECIDLVVTSPPYDELRDYNELVHVARQFSNRAERMLFAQIDKNVEQILGDE